MAPKAHKLPRHKPGETFLKGPIPLPWLYQAGQQPGKALHVAIALWFLAGVKRSHKVALSGALLRRLGVARHAGYRGLGALETAGLDSVERHSGRNPLVTILGSSKKENVEAIPYLRSVTETLCS